MALTPDYSTTDANYWRAVIKTNSGTKVLAVEVLRAGSSITRTEALGAFAVLVRALRARVSPDDIVALLRSIESEVVP